MADDANTGAGVPKGLRLVVRFWGAVSGLCECCCLIDHECLDFDLSRGFLSKKYLDLFLLDEIKVTSVI